MAIEFRQLLVGGRSVVRMVQRNRELLLLFNAEGAQPSPRVELVATQNSALGGFPSFQFCAYFATAGPGPCLGQNRIRIAHDQVRLKKVKIEANAHED